MATKRNKKSDDFPLTRCTYGKGGKKVRWRKIIRGRSFYFGAGEDPDVALADYLAVKHHLELGRTLDEARSLAARADGKSHGRVTVDELANRFVADKIAAYENDDIQLQTLRDYKHAAKILIGCFGRSTIVEELTVSDFVEMKRKMQKGRVLQTVKNMIVNVKIIFKFGYERDLLDRPMKFGREFNVTSRAVAKSRIDSPTFYFTAPQLRELIEKADPILRAQILLGINGALGNKDVALLRELHVDFENGWINYPRRKTGQARSFPLWPETLEAIRAAIEVRPLAKLSDEFDCIFIGRNGRVTVRDHGHNQIRRRFRNHMDKVGDFPSGAGFYTLRRTFITIGRKTGRSLCVKYIAGHAMTDISDRYDATVNNANEIFDPAGLVEVSQYVRNWLLSDQGDENNQLPSMLNLSPSL